MWLSDDVVRSGAPFAGSARPVVAAIPARDEARWIAACLAALDAAAGRSGAPVTLVVSANNCIDDTARIAAAFRPRHCRVVVEAVQLPPEHNHAGGARHAAMEMAASLTGADGVVMTTDADSRVDVDWVAANLQEIARGADAVAGMIAFSRDARAELPDMPVRALEWRLATLHARLEHLLDPREHDPWPRHIWAWGASLAVTVAAYRAVGGLPRIPLAEDRAFADAIDRAGLRLRRSHAPLVYTSPRRAGRAPGGFADLLDRYASDPAAPCDAALEPTAVLIKRLAARHRHRRQMRDSFVASWPAIDAAMVRNRLTPACLTSEIALAERTIATLERRASRRSGNPVSVIGA